MVIFGEKYVVCDVNNVHLHLEIVKSILLTDACRWKSVYCRRDDMWGGNRGNM